MQRALRLAYRVCACSASGSHIRHSGPDLEKRLTQRYRPWYRFQRAATFLLPLVLPVVLPLDDVVRECQRLRVCPCISTRGMQLNRRLQPQAQPVFAARVALSSLALLRAINSQYRDPLCSQSCGGGPEAGLSRAVTLKAGTFSTAVPYDRTRARWLGARGVSSDLCGSEDLSSSINALFFPPVFSSQACSTLLFFSVFYPAVSNRPAIPLLFASAPQKSPRNKQAQLGKMKSLILVRFSPTGFVRLLTCHSSAWLLCSTVPTSPLPKHVAPIVAES